MTSGGILGGRRDYLPLMKPSSTRSLRSDSQYPVMAATAPMKMAVNTRSPLAASVARAQMMTPKNICCRTTSSSSVISAKKPAGSAEEVWHAGA